MTNLMLFDIINEAQQTLVENWGDQGKEVIALCFKARKRYHLNEKNRELAQPGFIYSTAF